MEKNHCQICEREIKAGNKKGLIAHHGYHRPFKEGWQSDSCWGARHLPYEVSCAQIQPCIDFIKAYNERQEARLKAIIEYPPTTLNRSYSTKVVERPEGFNPIENAEKGSYGQGEAYGYEFRQLQNEIRRSIESGKRDIIRLEKRLANWVAPTV